MDSRSAKTFLRAELPFTSKAPSIARTALRSFARELPLATLDDALLMVSELATNAIVHGRPEIILRVWLEPRWLTVAVTDGGDMPIPSPGGLPAAGQPHGRGLALVNDLAAHWDTAHSDEEARNEVWFDLARP